MSDLKTQLVNEKQQRARRYRRDWYYRNSKYVQDKVFARKRELCQWFENYKSTLSCIECGQNHPAALDFHHRNSQDKDVDVCKAVTDGWSKERILEEIAKCDVLCASCHRILHWEERKRIDMKAVEWAAKFEAVPVSETPPMERFADVLKEFGVETAELVAARTKGSKQGSEFPAADGAVREQKNKFRAICGRVPALTEAMFDLLLEAAVPNFALWKAAAQKKAEKPADDVKDYRKKHGGKHHHKENSHGKGRKDQVHSGSNSGVRT